MRERLLHADHARQALRAAGSRQQPDGDFRQADDGLRIIGDDAMVAGEGQLEAAAQRQAVDRGDEGLAAGLQPPMHVVEGLWLKA